jgi:hypothetical protein
MAALGLLPEHYVQPGAFWPEYTRPIGWALEATFAIIQIGRMQGALTTKGPHH